MKHWTIELLNRLSHDPSCGEGLGDACAFAKAMDDEPYWRTILRWYVLNRCWWEWLMAHTVCKWHGCDWVDESYANGDTGCDAGHCRRCGYSFHHTYY